MTDIVNNDTLEYLDDLCKGCESKLIECGYSKLMIAIKNGMLKTIKKLMTTKNLIAFSDDNKNALTIACEFNMEDIAEQIFDTLGHRYLLLEKDNDNNDALTFICKHKMKKMFDHVRNTRIKSTYYRSCDDNKLNIIEYVNVEKINKDNETLFIIICKNKLNAFGLDLLKDNFDYNLNHQDNEGKTALMHAIENGLLNLAIKIAKKMKNINQVSDNGNTAILLSAMKNYTKVSLELIKNKKIDLTICEKEYGCTPLIFATMEDNKEVVAEMIKKECNISHTDSKGEDALSSAVLNCNETISLMIAKKWDIDFNHLYAVGKNQITIMTRVLSLGLTKLCSYIIESGKYNLGYIDFMNKTLLINLAEKKYEWQIELLLKSKEDIKCGHEDNSKTTALMYCAFKDMSRISGLIIKRNDCNPSCLNIDRLDCIGHLLVHGHEDIVYDLFLRHTKEMKDWFNEVYYVAEQRKMKKLEKFLRKKITMKFIPAEKVENV